METVIMIVAIVFMIFMVVSLFKYANFIHHFPHPEKEQEKAKQEGDDASKDGPNSG